MRMLCLILNTQVTKKKSKAPRQKAISLLIWYSKFKDPGEYKYTGNKPMAILSNVLSFFVISHTYPVHILYWYSTITADLIRYIYKWYYR